MPGFLITENFSDEDLEIMGLDRDSFNHLLEETNSAMLQASDVLRHRLIRWVNESECSLTFQFQDNLRVKSGVKNTVTFLMRINHEEVQ